MKVRWLEADEPLDVQRGEVVICIPVFGGHQLFVRCLSSVLAHTPAAIRILICDDASPDSRSVEHVRELEGSDHAHELTYVHRRQNVGFPANVNGALAAAAPADVVVLNSDCVVASGWLDGLRSAAYIDSTVATATALTNHGTILSVPERGVPLPDLPPDWDFDAAAAAVAAGSLRLRPRLPTAIGHCVLFRRTALELVGDFDLVFSPGYGEEVDFSQRCLRAGLCHVAADEVLVLHQGAGSFGAGESQNERKQANERTIERRYPHYRPAVRSVEEDHSGPLARSLGAARRALKGMRVVIDARILVGPTTGVQVHVLEVISALARLDQAHVVALLPEQLNPAGRAVLDALPNVERMSLNAEARASERPRADVFHRPFQLGTHADLVVAAQLGERLVVTQQDLIAYHNPAYFSSFGAWDTFRNLTRRALVVADRVVFISEHGRDDALREELLDPGRATVVRNGVDHTVEAEQTPGAAPPAAAGIPSGAEVMLCLGTDFHHKNRLFALRLLEELVRTHGFSGLTVFAGAHVTTGSSREEEQRFLGEHPQIRPRLLDLGPVSEPEKAWLLRRASLVLYPTVHEGFGLVPFEAADHGTPCLWAAGTSLAELLDDRAAGLVAWDPQASALRVLALMRDADERQANLDAIRRAGAGLTWEAAGAQLLRVYAEACDQPAAPASVLERRHGEMQHWISDDAMRLVGPKGHLPKDMERPLLALATHRPLGSPIFRAVRAGYLASYRLRRARQRLSPDGRSRPSAADSNRDRSGSLNT